MKKMIINFYNMQRSFISLVLVSIFIAASCGAVFAQQEYKVNIRADRLVYDESGETATLGGNVVFSHKDITLSGAKAVFNNNTRKGSIRGGVRVSQPGVEITGRELRVNFNENTAVLNRNVQMVVQPDNSITAGTNAADMITSVTTLTAEDLVYNWLSQRGEATGGVQVVQGSKRAFADRAVYNGFTSMITLEGNVRFEQGSSDWLYADRAYLDMRREVFTAAGGVSGSFVVDVQEGEGAGATVPGIETETDLIPLPSLPMMNAMTPE